MVNLPLTSWLSVSAPRSRTERTKNALCTTVVKALRLAPLMKRSSSTCARVALSAMMTVCGYPPPPPRFDGARFANPFANRANGEPLPAATTRGAASRTSPYSRSRHVRSHRSARAREPGDNPATTALRYHGQAVIAEARTTPKWRLSTRTPSCVRVPASRAHSFMMNPLLEEDADDWLVQAIANRDSPARPTPHTGAGPLQLSFTPEANDPRTPTSRIGMEALRCRDDLRMSQLPQLTPQPVVDDVLWARLNRREVRRRSTPALARPLASVAADMVQLSVVRHRPHANEPSFSPVHQTRTPV
jgi:hypothetical protein